MPKKLRKVYKHRGYADRDIQEEYNECQRHAKSICFVLTPID